MPYYITEKNTDCDGWAVVDGGDGFYGCHISKGSAIKQAVAISLNTDEPFDGERAAVGQLKIGDYVSWNVDDPKILAQVVEVNGEYAVLSIFELEDNNVYSPEDKLMIMNIQKLQRIQKPEMIAYEAETMDQEDDSMTDPNEPIDPTQDVVEDLTEDRAVNLSPPAFMKAAARQGLKYYEEGLGGDGLVPATIREARALVAGNVTADKWVRMGAWIARHTSDLDSPAANPSNENYPSAGVVAHLLWGSGPSKRSAQRAMAYANNVVSKLEEANRSRSSVESESMAKIEQRISTAEFEVREGADGMTFEGYAAIFDSPSEPLPFIERIKRGAFNRSLTKARNDIKLLWNHDTSAVLGSTRAGTLKLVEDNRGLKVIATLPNTTQGRDAAVLLKRGDVDSMSFGFSVPAGGDDWNEDGSERVLKSVRLHEVSIVAFPAYTSTAGTTSVRGLDKIAERAAVSADDLADAMLNLEEGKDLTPEAADLLRAVINELAPTPEAEVIDELGDLEMLELKKTKLKLLEM
jgi:HK97 family phage prohead protease